MQKTSQFKDFPFSTSNDKPEKEETKDVSQNENLIEDIKHDILEVFDEPEEVLQTVDEEEVPEEALMTEPELEFKLNHVPGADYQDEIVEEEPEEMVVDESTEEKDVWNCWRKKPLSEFLGWVKDRFANIPKHSGTDTTGIERVISYFDRIDSEISKAMREDYNREIDASKAEEARAELADGKHRLEERRKKLLSKKFKKIKKGTEDAFITKEAGTPRGTGSIVVSVPYLVSNIARTCINGMVSSGRDIEETFKSLANEYKLDNRERFQVAQLIQDMGYQFTLDRAAFHKPELKPSENYDGELSLQYQA